MPRYPPYRAIVFDFFGTLTQAVVRGPDHDRVAWRLGCEPSQFFALLDQTFPERAAGRHGSPAEVIRLVAASLGARPTEPQVRAAVRDRTHAIRADIRLRPEALRALQAARAGGLRIGLISDCTEELPTLMAGSRIGRLLDAAVYSVQAGRSKPDPLLYVTACRRLGVRPRDCLYIGDGGGQELSGARAAGLTAIQLVAPDLADHLVFDAEIGWDGGQVASLTEAVGLALAGPGRGRLPGI
jgi:putative hydrolase of the HAD superfamily